MDLSSKLEKSYDCLIQKSQEVFILAIELYNKPTIKYRVEGFAFFICNAWELMLKAYLIKTKGADSIYFNKDKSKTITLDYCIKLIFTNNQDPLRMNLEKIIELRNASTHYITEEYEMVYLPLFQSCIFNYNDKMFEFHNIDVTKLIPINFLNLVITEKYLDENELKAKYSEGIVNKLLDTQSKINNLIENTNSKFAIKVEHVHYLTHNSKKATDTLSVVKNSKNEAMIIKELQDPNNTHKYNSKKVIKEVNVRLGKQNITLMYRGAPTSFNQFHFNLFCKYYDIKNNRKWCYIIKQFSQPQYSYSIQAIDFIFEEIKKDPSNIIENIKERLKKLS